MLFMLIYFHFQKETAVEQKHIVDDFNKLKAVIHSTTFKIWRDFKTLGIIHLPTNMFDILRLERFIVKN